MPTPGWTVTAQTQTVDIGPDGKSTDVVRVDYANDAGTIAGHVQVPVGPGWDDQASMALAARYAEHDKVSAA